MDRRQTLRALGALAASNFAGSSLLADFLATSASLREGAAEWVPKLLSPAQAKLLPELVETIIPKTDTPGARDALVHVFVDLFVADCYPADRRAMFLEGLDALERASEAAYGRKVLELSGEERLALMTRLERESFEKNEPAESSFIRSLKSLTLLGYFSSQPGATEAAEYEHAPGPFRGCVPLEPGRKVQAIQ
jgi:gluconate 2-dehydrogenase gamma chain